VRRGAAALAERAVALLSRHRAIAAAVLLALAVRLVAWYAISPAWWIIGDSIGYIRDALLFIPETWRPSGYALLLLRPLLPFHQLALVTAVQHLMGLAAGVLVYATLLRAGLARWAAALAALPALFDGYLIGSEQMLASEPLFGILVLGGLCALAWSGGARPGWAAVALGGLLLGLGATTRIVGLPLIAVAALALLLQRAGWRRLGVLAVAFALPVAAYAAWFSVLYGTFDLTASSGVFLYGSTVQFVQCDRVPFTSEQLRGLCPTEPLGHRDSAFYVFDGGSPLGRAHLGVLGSDRVAGQFAMEVIRAQPGDFALQMLDGVWETFTSGLDHQPLDVRFQPGELMNADARAAGIAYQGADPGPTYRPAALGLMEDYQDAVWVPGTLFLLGLAISVAGLLAGREAPGRRLRPLLVLSAGTAAVLLLVPAMTALPAPRYRVPAIPALCLAVALAAALLINRLRAPAPPRPAASPSGRTGPAGTGAPGTPPSPAAPPARESRPRRRPSAPRAARRPGGRG
jgi:hypothetical protein